MVPPTISSRQSSLTLISSLLWVSLVMSHKSFPYVKNNWRSTWSSPSNRFWWTLLCVRLRGRPGVRRRYNTYGVYRGDGGTVEGWTPEYLTFTRRVVLQMFMYVCLSDWTVLSFFHVFQLIKSRGRTLLFTLLESWTEPRRPGSLPSLRIIKWGVLSCSPHLPLISIFSILSQSLRDQSDWPLPQRESFDQSFLISSINEEVYVSVVPLWSPLCLLLTLWLFPGTVVVSLLKSHWWGFPYL